MRKGFYVCAALAVVLAAATSAKAVPVITTNNGLAVWFDTRATEASILSPAAPFTVGTSILTQNAKKTITFTRSVTEGNDGGPGDGQVLYISPRLPTVAPDTEGKHITYNAKKTIRIDNSVKTLSQYATVGNRAAVNEVVAALGQNINVVKNNLATAGNKIQTLSIAQNPALWSTSGTTFSVTDNAADQTNWTIAAKAVKVPVSAGPVFDSTGGARPTADGGVASGVYRTGTITVTAGQWNKIAGGAANSAPLDSTYCVKIAVNNLLITRVYNGVGPTPELPDFGYTEVGDATTATSGNGPEAAAGNGNTVGVTSTNCDAEIRIQMKGDHNNDGLTNASDQAGQNAAIAAVANIRIRELYLGDFNNSNTVDAADQNGMNAYIGIAGLGCPPCP